MSSFVRGRSQQLKDLLVARMSASPTSCPTAPWPRPESSAACSNSRAWHRSRAAVNTTRTRRRRNMARLSKDDLARLLEKPGYTVGHCAFIPATHTSVGPRPHRLVQEHEDDPAGAGQPSGDVDNGPEETTGDERVHPRYRTRFVICVSDRRRRDADGAISTVLDCLVRAARRLAGLDTGERRVSNRARKAR